MDKTPQAARRGNRKILRKNLKKQKRNAKTVAKRIEKIEAKLWEIELEEVNESGIISQLTWEYNDRVRLFGATAIGFRSKERNSNSEAVKEIQRWIWKNRNTKLNHVKLFTKTIDDYKILLALQMDYADDDYDDQDDSRLVVTIFALDSEETGTGYEAEKKALIKFAKDWNIDVKVDT